MKKILITFCSFLISMGGFAQLQTNDGVEYLQNLPKDMSTDFSDMGNTYFLADSLSLFDTTKGEGLVNWKRYRLSPRQAFNLNGYWPVRMKMLDFPDTQYDNDPNLKIRIRPIDDRTIRITMYTSPIESAYKDSDNPMLSPEFIATHSQSKGTGSNATITGGNILYRLPYGELEIQKYPFRLIIKDKDGRLLTQTRHIIDDDSTQVKLLPFNFIKRGSDNSRSINPVFLLSPGERIYGCGESFTSLNKVGQKINLFVTDPQARRPTESTSLCHFSSQTAATVSS